MKTVLTAFVLGATLFAAGCATSGRSADDGSHYRYKPAERAGDVLR